MSMTTSVTLRYEGPDSCADCQRAGIPLCDHIGFNSEAWDALPGQAVTVPGLDNHGDYVHTLRSYSISGDRKTVALQITTQRPPHHDLARHLSTYPNVRAKAWVRGVHHETGDVLEEGHYDRHLIVGMSVAIDRDLYQVVKVEHPNRDPDTGVAADGDLQVAHLVPVDPETVTAVAGGAG